MAKMPMEFDDGGVITDTIASPQVSSITTGNNGTFTLTIPSKTGYVPVMLVIMNYLAGGSAQPLIPLGIAFQLNSSSTSVTAYARNSTGATVSNVKAQAVVLYKPI